jgi:hypothetical protein
LFLFGTSNTSALEEVLIEKMFSSLNKVLLGTQIGDLKLSVCGYV